MYDLLLLSFLPQTWDEILNPELGIDSSHENVIFKDTLFVLRYFVEGFGLIVDTLCKEQLRSKDNICDLSQLGKSILVKYCVFIMYFIHYVSSLTTW